MITRQSSKVADVMKAASLLSVWIKDKDKLIIFNAKYTVSKER